MLKINHCYSDKRRISISFGLLFIVPIAILSIFFLPFGIEKQPLLIAAACVSLTINSIFAVLYALYVGLKADRYVQKHDFHLWKKSKSHSLRERREAARAIDSMQIPSLEKSFRYANKIAFFLLVVWTLIFFGVFSFIIFTA
jgi:hypothetical protein